MRAIVAAPSVIAAIFVLTVFADSGSVLESLPRPFAVAVGASLALQLVAVTVARGWRVGSLAASLVLLTVITPATPLIVVAAFIVRELYRRHGRQGLRVPVGRYLMVMLAISGVRTVLSPAFALTDLTLASSHATASVPPGTGPDIVVLWLDGHPRSDTLVSWGEDNSWFEAGLAARGFFVSPQSHSNYSQTALVLPTMFHMRHAYDIGALLPVSSSRAAQERAIRSALEATPVTNFLHARGYRVVSAGLPSHYLSLAAADEYVSGGQLSEFEHQILTRTTLDRFWPELALSQRREVVLAALAAAAETAEAGPAAPYLFFAHIMSPHTPFIFNAEGDAASLSCVAVCHPWNVSAADMGLSRRDYQEAYAEQVRFLDGVVLATIDRVIAASPNAIVIVLSDHGARGAPVSDEWFASFFAARTPGHPRLFPADARPIELFPRLLNAYFGQGIPVPPDQSFHSPLGSRLPLSTLPWPLVDQ